MGAGHPSLTEKKGNKDEMQLLQRETDDASRIEIGLESSLGFSDICSRIATDATTASDVNTGSRPRTRTGGKPPEDSSMFKPYATCTFCRSTRPTGYGLEALTFQS
ncbi:hypothetical protein F2P81_005251 [Scophthalmus maximus]|uniref:Uncharacterized protein n=1 Tax=Scophthalmus maximus TaxID=52904 RepID=A0A6A4TA42_SCOMX|nr:hypothetical protein F2P81_005251 [Scophthalmus maximus]